MSKTRLQHEILKLSSDTPEHVLDVGPVDSESLFKWKARIVGPPNTPYEGGIYQVDIDIPTEYPFKPPKLRFLTKIFHPNISQKGTVCIDILQEQWSPALTITNVLLSVLSLLAAPNADDPMNAEAAKLYIEDARQYNLVAKQWTDIYASGQ